MSPRPPVESIEDVPERKLCPPPVASFIGRKDILDKMRSYFDAESTSQRIFVLHGLGGAGKSQLAFKFIEESRGKRYIDWLDKITPWFTNDMFLVSPISSTLTLQMRRLFKRISRPLSLEKLSKAWMRVCGGLRARPMGIGSSSSTTRTMST